MTGWFPDIHGIGLGGTLCRRVDIGAAKTNSTPENGSFGGSDSLDRLRVLPRLDEELGEHGRNAQAVQPPVNLRGEVASGAKSISD